MQTGPEVPRASRLPSIKLQQAESGNLRKGPTDCRFPRLAERQGNTALLVCGPNERRAFVCASVHSTRVNVNNQTLGADDQVEIR